MAQPSEFSDFEKLAKYMSSLRSELGYLFGQCRQAAKAPTPMCFLNAINQEMDTPKSPLEEPLNMSEMLECCEVTEDLPPILQGTSGKPSQVNSSNELCPENSTRIEEKAPILDEVVELFRISSEQYVALRSKLCKNAGKYNQYNCKLKELCNFLSDLEKSLPQEKGDKMIETLSREEELQIEKLREDVDILCSAKIQISHSNDHEELSRILNQVLPIAKQLLEA